MEPTPTPASGPRVQVQARSGTVTGVALVVLAVAVAAVSLLHGGAFELAGALPAAALFAALGWAVFLSPHAVIGPQGVRLVRSVSVTDLPWEHFEDADADWGLKLTATDGSTTTWTGISAKPGAPEKDLSGLSMMQEGAAHGSATSRRHMRDQLGASRSRSVQRRSDERTRAHGDLPLGRFTDAGADSVEKAKLTAAQAALVIATYRDLHRCTTAGTRTGGFTRSPRWSGILAMLVPTILTVLFAL